MVAVFTQMLEREYGEGLGEQAAQYMRYTLQGARRMEELLKDLLSYVRALNAGDEGVSRTDADAVLDQTIANLDGVIQATGAVVERGRLPVVMIQRIHLLQLFQNIVGNALKYRAEDQPRICVWAQPVSAEQNNPVWRFNIRDNGIGIEPRFAQHIFGVFKRLHSGHDKYPGTGIGLAICQKIVERYGGRIWSNPKAQEKDRSSRSPSPPPKPVRVVLAEDNPGDVFLIDTALRLEHLDVELIVERDGEKMLQLLEAVEAGQAACPDIVLMDLNLPKYGGDVLLQRMRTGRICAGVPVIIVTSSPTPPTITPLRSAGMPAATSGNPPDTTNSCVWEAWCARCSLHPDARV